MNFTLTEHLTHIKTVSNGKFHLKNHCDLGLKVKGVAGSEQFSCLYSVHPFDAVKAVRILLFISPLDSFLLKNAQMPT